MGVQDTQLGLVVLGGAYCIQQRVSIEEVGGEYMMAANTTNNNTDYLYSLCHQEESSYHIPDICHHLATHSRHTIPSNYRGIEIVRPVLGTGKNISIAAVLAGVLLILLIIAIILRLRQTKIVQLHSRGSSMMYQPGQHLLLHHPVESPPDYDTLVDSELPSYYQATTDICNE